MQNARATVNEDRMESLFSCKLTATFCRLLAWIGQIP